MYILIVTINCFLVSLKRKGSKAPWKRLQRKLELESKHCIDKIAAVVKRATRRDKRNFYRRKSDDAEKAAVRGNQRELFKISKELDGTRKTYNGLIKDENVNKLNTDREKNKR